MKTSFKFVCILFAVSLNLRCAAAPDTALALPRSSPEQQGVSSSALLAFVDAADREIEGIHSFMLVRHGHVVAEGWWAPYNPQSPHELYSLSKSFTSTAVGLAVAEGKLSVHDEVLKFFPEHAPAEPSANLKAMRVSDLLRMATGHQDEPVWRAGNLTVKLFLDHPVPHKPGTHFKYNTAATFMLSAIVQKVTGETVLDYLRPRLFEPLGIEHPTWGANAEGITLGGYGLSVRTEDIARFGQLYLQKGQWGGKPLLPGAWVEAATGLQVATGSNPNSDWDQGYGYQFWRCRHGAYRGDGAFGQYCVVVPRLDAVIAITGGLGDMQQVLNLVWDRLLPALGAQPMPADRESQKALERRLAGLELPPAQGRPSSPMASTISGRRFVFAANERKLETIGLEVGTDGQGVTLVTRIGGVERRLACGKNAWTKARHPFGPYPEQPVCVSGAWTADDTYVVKMCAYETPFVATFKLRFSGDQVTFDQAVNVSFGPTKQPQLTGRAER
ncbi:MAG: serine hydrolase [Verrucomicrobia bacterium]|nr:serine hydrolase [Verrucomicrobiota bacterium]OQC66086.1 MAG: 6-aminohexanoate-dimer hydrolase [Verrucomicrobia bacterium ADurb.Bin006]MDI9380840.1 serine hydrolase [Verrucomicrobiota bacterium]NMD18838.1 serine hydrolase [Verrucomicrobiota bacterium]HNU99516.1 serine hydrolase [Verrucomicrobiota bacterium]